MTVNEQSATNLVHGDFLGTLEHYSTENDKFSKLSQNLTFDTAIIGLIKIISQYKDEIEFKGDLFVVKDTYPDLIGKITFFLEFLANSTFTFEYNPISMEYYCKVDLFNEDLLEILN